MKISNKTIKETGLENRGTFENSPISFWEEDFSEVKIFFDNLKSKGIRDVRSFFELHPEELDKVSSLIEVLDINQASMDMFDVSSKEELSKVIADYFTEESLDVFKEELIALFNGEKHFESLIPIKHPNGKMLVLELRLRILKDHYHDWERVIVSFVDITQRKQFEQDLQKSKELLEESNETKNKLFSIIAHDLQSPFNSILGFTNMLLEDFDTLTNSEKKLYLEVVNNSAVNALDRLKNLLSWARSQLDKLEINKELCNIRQIVEESIQAYKLSAQIKNIDTVVDIEGKMLVFIDKNTISTVIANLYNNAVKFTPENGLIRISAVQQKKHIDIVISDTGVGMSPEGIQEIFHLGTSKSTLGTNNETGTGLGLIICKDFVEKNNGTIDVKSEENVGSTFRISLPKFY